MVEMRAERERSAACKESKTGLMSLMITHWTAFDILANSD